MVAELRGPDPMARRSRKGRVGTPATRALADAGVDFGVHHYDHDPRADAYGEEAVDALGLDPARVFKTLVAEVDGRLAVGVVPVSGRLDLKALAAALGGKHAAMADPAAAERSSGYVVGGISPLGMRRALPTVIDESARSLPRVFVSAGRRGVQLDLAPEALARATGAIFAPISRH